MNAAAESEPPVLVSVILTSYNYADYVRQAVESVLGQTYPHLELIAVDDGSTDDSPRILEGFSDPRMRCVLKSNGGQASAWNAAFPLCRGELVLFIDSDDYWMPGKVEEMVHWHRRLGGRYGVLQHNLMQLRDGKESRYRRTLQSGDCYADMLATDNIFYFVPTSGLGFTRRVLDEIFPLPTILRISPDAFVVRTAFVYGEVFSIARPLGVLRLHGKNAGMMQQQKFHARLRRDVIFPALNAYYERKGWTYRFGVKRRRPLIERLRQLRWRIQGVFG